MFTTNTKKYCLGTFIVIVLIALTLLWYFKFPLPGKSVLDGMDSVDKIHFGEYIDENWDNAYNIEIQETEAINKILDEFYKSEYTRVPAKNIKNDSRYLSIRIILDGSDHYRVAINEHGYLVVEDDATYKFTKNRSEIFHALYNLLVVGNEPVIETKKRN